MPPAAPGGRLVTGQKPSGHPNRPGPSSAVVSRVAGEGHAVRAGRITVKPRQFRPGDEIRVGARPRRVARIERIEGGARVFLTNGERLVLANDNDFDVARPLRRSGAR